MYTDYSHYADTHRFVLIIDDLVGTRWRFINLCMLTSFNLFDNSDW